MGVKVRDLDGPVVGDEEVVELEVAVEDSIRVQPQHPCQDLPHHLTPHLQGVHLKGMVRAGLGASGVNVGEGESEWVSRYGGTDLMQWWRSPREANSVTIIIWFLAFLHAPISNTTFGCRSFLPSQLLLSGVEAGFGSGLGFGLAFALWLKVKVKMRVRERGCLNRTISSKILLTFDASRPSLMILHATG